MGSRDASEEDLRSDMMHTNAVDYNAELDQIALSSYHYSEVYIIDHSTSTKEAAGHSGGRWGKGGDLLYRWGNPKNYKRGDDESMQLFAQHDVHWIDDGLPGAGNILIFNNGFAANRASTTVVELTPPMNADGSYTRLVGTKKDGEDCQQALIHQALDRDHDAKRLKRRKPQGVRSRNIHLRSR